MSSLNRYGMNIKHTTLSSATKVQTGRCELDDRLNCFERLMKRAELLLNCFSNRMMDKYS